MRCSLLVDDEDPIDRITIAMEIISHIPCSSPELVKYFGRKYGEIDYLEKWEKEKDSLIFTDFLGRKYLLLETNSKIYYVSEDFNVKDWVNNHSNDD